MLTWNDKITSSNRVVEKTHWKHQGCYVEHENFLFPTIISRCLGLNALDIMFTGQSKAVIFFVLGLLEGCGAGGGLQISWNFVFVACSHHVLQVPKTIPQHVPDGTTLLYHKLCQKP
jgi:hypothetical protein